MVGDPADHAALDGQRAGDREREPQPALGLERAVGEVAVEADRDAEAGDQVEGDRETDVDPAEAPAPGDRRSRRAGRGTGRSRSRTAGSARPCPCARRSSASGRAVARIRQSTWVLPVGVGAEGAFGCRPVDGEVLPWLRHRNLRIRNLRPPHPGRSRYERRPGRRWSRLGAVVQSRGGWGNRQPAGLWSRAVSVRVRVPQPLPDPADPAGLQRPARLDRQAVPSDARSLRDGRPPDRGRRARRGGGHPDAVGPSQGAARDGRPHARRSRAGRGRARSARTRTLVVVGAGREAVAAHLGRDRARTRCRSCRPSSAAPGTPSGSRWRPRRRSTAPSLVLPGDTPLLRTETLRRLVEEHQSSGAVATLLTAVLPDPTGYGRVLRRADGRGRRGSSSTATRPTSSGPSTRSTRACTRSSPARCGTR